MITYNIKKKKGYLFYYNLNFYTINFYDEIVLATNIQGITCNYCNYTRYTDSGPCINPNCYNRKFDDSVFINYFNKNKKHKISNYNKIYEKNNIYEYYLQKIKKSNNIFVYKYTSPIDFTPDLYNELNKYNPIKIMEKIDIKEKVLVHKNTVFDNKIIPKIIKISKNLYNDNEVIYNNCESISSRNENVYSLLNNIDIIQENVNNSILIKISNSYIKKINHESYITNIYNCNKNYCINDLPFYTGYISNIHEKVEKKYININVYKNKKEKYLHF